MAERLTSDGAPRPSGAVIGRRDGPDSEPTLFLSNAEIADRLASLAQLLSAQKENPYKVKAYQRAAAKLRNMSESLHELVQDEADLTQYAGIGDAIASAIREIVQTGTLRKLETLRAQATFAIKQTDFGIKPFRGGPAGTVKVADRVTFTIDAVAVQTAARPARTTPESPPKQDGAK